MRARRATPKDRYTQVLNEVARDHRVSWRARGLLLELLSHSEQYEINIDDLVKQAKRGGGAVEGRDAMRAAIKELEAVGYITRKVDQSETGQWRTELFVHDEPKDLGKTAGRADDWKPGVGKPVVGKPGANKKTNKKTKKKTPPPSPSENAQVAPGTDFQAPVEKQGEDGKLRQLEKQHPQAADFVAKLPAGGKTRGKVHHSALITEVARLIDGGADLGKVRVALVSKLDTAGHWFSTMASRAAEYDPSSFMPAIPKAPAKPAESDADATGAPQAPQTPGEANQRARAEMAATRKKLAELNALRQAERQRELSPVT